jgi:hypothetical protein
VDEQEQYEQARKQVRRIRGFYVHALVYVLVNALVIFINATTASGVWWSLWTVLGWGIGLAAHAIAVFGLGGLWGPQWEERKIREILEKRRAG